MRFDPRFSALLRIPIKTDTSKLSPEQSLAHRLLTPTKRKRPGTDEETTAVSEEHGMCISITLFRGNQCIMKPGIMKFRNNKHNQESKS